MQSRRDLFEAARALFSHTSLSLSSLAHLLAHTRSIHILTFFLVSIISPNLCSLACSFALLPLSDLSQFSLSLQKKSFFSFKLQQIGKQYSAVFEYKFKRLALTEPHFHLKLAMHKIKKIILVTIKKVSHFLKNISRIVI
jgi:hypothetical protein